MKYFVDAVGKYLGGFDGANPPAGSVEIPEPPEHGEDTRREDGTWDTSTRTLRKNPQKLALVAILNRMKTTDSTRAAQYQSLLDDLNNESA